MNQESETRKIRHDWILEHEQAIERFEAAWREDGFPELAEFLPPEGERGRDELVLELVRVDMEFRAARGQPRRVIEYSGHLGVDETLALTDAEFEETPLPEEGELLGRYELRGTLGQGAFATVYRAWDTELRREVALKVPHRQILDRPELRERFLREARSVARLSHPAIVPIHEVGRAGDTAFIVYELMPGESLAAMIERVDLAPEQAALWVERLCLALDHAHRHGIVHRDVKPGNVLMNHGGEPMLTDFGLATHAETDETLTREGDLLGTPAYMSPEQARGEGHLAGPTSDVYSLGVVLYELLTGKRPFETSGVGVLYEVVYNEPLAPREHSTAIPGDLEVICLKAMAKEPDRRYSSAHAFGEDLRRWIEHRPIEARRMSAFERLALWCRRRPAQAATVAVALVVVLAVVTISFFRVVAERDRYREANIQSQQNLYRALASAARSTTIAGETGWYWNSLELLQQASALDVENRDVAELRSLALDVLGSETPCFRLLETCVGHTGSVRAVAASPDGTLAASASTDGTVRIWRVDSGAAIAVLEGHEDIVMAVAFVAGGRSLVSASLDGTVRIWDTESHEVLQVVDLGSAVRALAVSPEGDRFVSGCEDGTIRLHDPEGTEPAEILGNHTGAIAALSWSPDGARLASGGADGLMRVWNVETRDVSWTWSHVDPMRTLCFSPDSQSVAVAVITWYDFMVVQNGKTSNSGAGPRHQDSLLDLSWDATWGVLTTSADGTVRLWHGLDERAVASGVPSAAVDACFVPGGRRVLAGYTDGTLRIWQLSEPEATVAPVPDWNSVAFIGDTRQLVSWRRILDLGEGGGGGETLYAPAPVTAMAVESELGRLAVGSRDGEVRVIDPSAREVLGNWHAHEGSVAALASLPGDGGTLASSDGSGEIVLWDWRGGRRGRIESAVGGVHELIADGDTLLCAGEIGVEAWRASVPPDLRWRVPLPLAERRSMALAAGHLAVAPGDDTEIVILDGRSGSMTADLPDQGAVATHLAFSPDGSTLFTIDAEGWLRFRAPGTGEDVAPPQLVEEPQDWFGLSAWSGDSVLLAGAQCELRGAGSGQLARLISGLDTAIVWDAANESVLFGTSAGSVRRVLRQEVDELVSAGGSGAGPTEAPWLKNWETVADGGHISQVWGVGASPDGRWVATAGHDEVVKLWRAPGMELVRTLRGDEALVWCVAFSPDSSLLASGGGGVRLWDVASGEQLALLEHDELLVVSVAFHPTLPLLASASLGGAVRLWHVEEQRLLGVLDTRPEAVHDVEFRPDGRWLAAALHEGDVALWQLGAAGAPAPGTPPDRVLHAQGGAVWAVAWSPDGQLLASASERGEVVVWHGETGERLATVQTTSSRIRSLAFSRDGGLLAYACYFGAGRVWDLGQLRESLRELDLDW